MCIVPKFIIDWFMIMVLLVLKLLVSSHPLKLEGVLCIYVLLLHEGQAENHLLCFPYGWNTHVTFNVSFSWSSLCVYFHAITWLLSFYYQDYVFHAHVLSSLISALNAYIDGQDCDGACHLKNYCFVITYLLEDEQELSLGMLIRLKRIYNFWCSMLVFTPFALCFVSFHGVFMRFPELTYWQDAIVPVPYFLLFLCFRKATQEIFSELDKTSSRTPIFPGRGPKTEREPEGARGCPHHEGARPRPWPCPPMVRPPWSPPDNAPLPISERNMPERQ
jgi:hypothetical protein